MKERINRYAIFALITIITLGASCSGTGISSDNNSGSYQVPIVDFDGIRPILEQSNDTTYIVNFWATWCAPCVRELPYFERITKEYANKKVKVILVNLDFPNHYETRLIPFLEENEIQSKVIMLDDPDANRWIPEVDLDWTGAIPATVIFNSKERKFFPREVKYEELEEVVQQFINQ